MTDNFDFSNTRAEADRIVKKCMRWCVGTAVLTGPIPGTSVILSGFETKLAFDIAKVYGFNPTLPEAGATITPLIAVSGVLKYVAVEASTALPVIWWWLIKPSIAPGAAKAVGEIAIGHYEQRKGGEKVEALPRNSLIY